MNWRAGAKCIDEVGPDLPGASLLGGNRNLFQRLAIGAAQALAPACAVKAIVKQVVVQDTTAARKPNTHPLSERRHAAAVVDRSGAVFDDGEDLDAVWSADWPA